MRHESLNDNQREMLVSCLTQIFGRVEDTFVDGLIPMLHWIELAGGQILFEQGAPEDGVYLVISGRLRALIKDAEGVRIAGEIVQGQTVGEMAVLTHEPRGATILAIRDSVLAHVSRESFQILTKRHPELTVHIARVIIDRLRRAGRRVTPARPKTICLLAVTGGVDTIDFAESLVASLERWGVVRLESSSLIDERFGPGTAQSTPAEPALHHTLTMWLDDLEFWHEYVVFAADATDTEWTRRSIRHADHILLLARADAPSDLHALENKFLAGDSPITAAQQTLVLLHDEKEARPRGTPLWLEKRPAVTRHLHLRPALARDMARLARILSGNGVGLVLAGGGARGFAHLGAYKALEEAGISVDCVGGTSIGAAMAALIAWDLPAQTLIDQARRTFSTNPTGDMNFLPMISLIRGRKLRRVIEQAVVDVAGFLADASDTWRTFFCVATNFSRAREIVLSRGDMANCVRASVSIPVALPPVILNGDLLLDGGTFNNFPTDVMGTMGAGRIIGVDLGRQKIRTFEHLTEVPSPWALFLDRWRPYAKRKYRLPSLGAILMETTILYSTSRQGLARQSVDILVNPDLGRIGLLEWKKFDKIVDIGYRQMKEVIASLPPETLALYRDEPEALPLLGGARA